MLLHDAGEGLTRHLRQNPELMLSAGKLVRQYHERQFENYGKVIEGKVQPDDLKQDRLIPLCRRMMRLAKKELLDGDLAEATYKAIEDFCFSGRPVLCHGEMALPHILVMDGKVTVPIDWAYMASRPAMYDLASLEVYCEISDFNFATFLEGYEMSPADYASDPDRVGCRLIHIVRQLSPDHSYLEKLKTVLRRSMDEVL